jgi:hypothetical protein
MTAAPGGKSKRRLLEQRPGVIGRWSRLRSHRVAKRMVRAYMRLWLTYKECDRIRASKSAFETIKHFAIKNENGKMKGTALLFNIGLYLLIADRDIQAAKIDTLTHPDEWKRKLSARIILLTIYEWDADQVTGRELRDALDLMLIPQELRQEATQALRKLRAIQEKATKQFSFIRNAAIAHRDPNALVQYRAIRDLNVEEVMKTAVEFYSAIGVFVSLLTKLMLAGSTLPAMLRQWTAATEGQTTGR